MGLFFRFCFGVLAGLCGCVITLSAQPTFPSWFKDTPSTPGVVYAIGFAPASFIPESGYEAARAHAAEQLRLARSVSIQGEQLFEIVPGKNTIYRGERMQMSSSIPEDLPLTIIDSVRTETMTLVLAATRPHSLPMQAFETMPSDPPDWTQHPTQRDGLYAVGVAPRYYYPLSSWMEAEYQARIQLAFSVVADQRSLTRGYGVYTHTVTATRTGVILQNAEVVSRWHDDETFYVLMKAGSATVLPKEIREIP